MQDRTIHNSQVEQTKDLQQTIFQETVDHLYRALPSSVTATIIIAAVLVSVLWDVIDDRVLFVWFLIMAIINVSRYVLFKYYIQSEKTIEQIPGWDKAFYILLVLTGLTWSTVSIWLLPDNNSIYHYFPELVLIGMSAGAVTSLSFSMRNVITYLTLVLLPLFISEVLIGTYLSYSVAWLTLVFIVFALVNAKRINHTTIENITLRYQSDEHKKELIESKNAAIEASSAKTNFISTISHELRTPLNAILGFGQLLKMSDAPKLNQEQDEQVQGVIDSGKHLLSLIEELLDLSKIETEKIDINIQDVSVTDAIDETITIINPLAQQYGIELENNINSTYLVKADYKRLKQIFINLISNAIKYNHKNGRVMINAKSMPDNNIRVFVSDNGDGLTPEQQASLFKPFQRFNRKKEGIGLGLYITQSLVEVMGGQIGLESEINKGSTFWFDLVLAEKVS